MNNKKTYYTHKIEYKDTLDKLKHVLEIYALYVNMKVGSIYLRPRLVEILAFYILKGYNDKTKELILQTIPNLSKANLNQINSELTKKGFLRIDSRSYRKKYLSDSMLQIKEYFMDGKNEDFCVFCFKFEKSA